MTLLESAEPIFQYVCRLNRVARKAGRLQRATHLRHQGTAPLRAVVAPAPPGASLDYAVVRGDIKAILEEMQQKGAKDFRLGSQTKKIELAMMFFVDSLISESQLQFAAQWNQNRLAYEETNWPGTKNFSTCWRRTSRTRARRPPNGWQFFTPASDWDSPAFTSSSRNMLRKTMLTIAPRIKRCIEVDEAAKICPDAYEAVDYPRPHRAAQPQGVCHQPHLPLLIVAALISYLWLYHSSLSG